MTEATAAQTITIKGEKIRIYHYELFVALLTSWKQSGMSQDDIEDLLLL